MPNNVKTYDGTGDPEDHVKNFHAAAQVERWAMPTWCHMFNSTLIGAARVWFDELLPESIDGYKDLKAAFLAYFMQQKKYVKDPVEIHNTKQRDGETIEEFMERFKVETGRIKGAPECMQISGFMHGVNNPKLTKRLNEHVLKTMEEMMITTIRGEAAAAGKKKGHTSVGSPLGLHWLDITQIEWLGSEFYFHRYGYCKYYKKRAKTGQKRTWERKEYTRDGKAYPPTATDIESEPLEDPSKSEEPQPLSLTPAPPSPDHTPITPHTDEESEPLKTSETRVTSSPSTTPPADLTTLPTSQQPPLT
ncbi:reverse transcriptase domain-containing protein [Tanacetum coccineum]|uniref:Reverse transcriptase domain-containing protein n=1 Tax=Tanacetum coccineum TaxID=301880 RepID=A0ABQ4YZX7_9ASTR